jgi:hypothetical protein
VAAFCLVSLMALIPVALQAYQQADTRSAMVNIAAMVVRDLQSTSVSTSTINSPRFQFPIPAAGGASGNIHTLYMDAAGNPTPATIDTAPTAASIYRITVQLYPPASGLKTVTMARIWITFPANADPAPGSLPAKYSNGFQTTVALNRN